MRGLGLLLAFFFNFKILADIRPGIAYFFVKTAAWYIQTFYYGISLIEIIT